MQNATKVDSESSSTDSSLDVSDLLLTALETRGKFGSNFSDEICLPSARTYKDVIDENILLNSHIIDQKIQNEKLVFLNKTLEAQCLDLQGKLNAKRAKYKTQIQAKDEEIQKLRHDTNLTTVQTTLTEKFESRISDLTQNAQETDQRLREALTLIKSLEEKLAKSEEQNSVLVSLMKDKETYTTTIEKDIVLFRKRLQDFGLPIPLTVLNQPPCENNALLLSKFCASYKV